MININIIIDSNCELVKDKKCGFQNFTVRRWFRLVSDISEQKLLLLNVMNFFTLNNVYRSIETFFWIQFCLVKLTQLHNCLFTTNNRKLIKNVINVRACTNMNAILIRKSLSHGCSFHRALSAVKIIKYRIVDWPWRRYHITVFEVLILNEIQLLRKMSELLLN